MGVLGLKRVSGVLTFACFAAKPCVAASIPSLKNYTNFPPHQHTVLSAAEVETKVPAMEAIFSLPLCLCALWCS